MTNYNVIDNFLEQKEFENLQTLLSYRFPWYFYDGINDVEKDPSKVDTYQFTHMFYENYAPKSDFLPLIYPLVNNLKTVALLRVKANLLTRTTTKVCHEYHTDFHSPLITTAVYYVNTNDGVTRLKIGDEVVEVESVANRLVTFNSRIQHAGTTCTDQKVRCVVNLNYITDVQN